MPRGHDLEILKASLPSDWQDVPIFSYSQLLMADRCGFSWYMNYYLKLKTKKKKAALDKGSFGHSMCQSLYNAVIDGQYDGPTWAAEVLPSIVMEISEGLEFQDQLTELAAAMKIVERYAYTDLLSGHSPVGTEQHFFVLVTTPSGFRFVLQGYTDLTTIDQRERVWVWDHKFTGKMWTPIELMMDSQLPVYQMLLRADGIPIHGLVVNQLNSYAYKDMAAQPNEKLFKREFMYRSEIQLSAIWTEFLALAERVGRMMAGTEPIYRSLRKDCSMCDYNVPCHDNLSGTPIAEAVESYNIGTAARRGMPAGESVEIVVD
jgi:hypothetical protein